MGRMLCSDDGMAGMYKGHIEKNHDKAEDSSLTKGFITSPRLVSSVTHTCKCLSAHKATSKFTVVGLWSKVCTYIPYYTTHWIALGTYVQREGTCAHTYICMHVCTYMYVRMCTDAV